MNKIKTAEEFLKDNFESDAINPQILIEFAKLHVAKALKEALESIPCLGSSTDIASYEEIEDAVLNAYDLNNIK